MADDGCVGGCAAFAVVPVVVGAASLVDAGIGFAALGTWGALGLAVPFAAALVGFGVAGGGAAVLILAGQRQRLREPRALRLLVGVALVAVAPVVAVSAGGACAAVAGASVGVGVGVGVAFAVVQAAAGLTLAVLAPRATLVWLELVGGVLGAA